MYFFHLACKLLFVHSNSPYKAELTRATKFKSVRPTWWLR